MTCTDRQVIEAQRDTISQLQDLIGVLPSWEHVKELEDKIKRLETLQGRSRTLAEYSN